MKTDKELLQLAAMAAGLDLTGHKWVDTPFYTGFQRRNFEDSGWELQTSEWNPLTDDGQALRLAVDLIMDVTLHERTKEVTAWVCDDEGVIKAIEPYSNDKHAATRRAIVRAAAAIGEGME